MTCFIPVLQMRDAPLHNLYGITELDAGCVSQACTVQVEKAPLESYADVGGLEQQVTEIKEAVELPLTHPELYQDIGIKPPKVQSSHYFTS